jgi:hypothetical protein
MNNLKKIYILSQLSFSNVAKENNLTDDNVELFKETAFISIINTNSYNDMQSIYSRDNAHWFKENHSNVLNLEFDDVESDTVLEGDTKYKAFSEEQARETIEFIDKNKYKTFFIHCLAGISRSGAVGRFLYDYYPWVDREWFDVNVKQKILPNQKVYIELKKIITST